MDLGLVTISRYSCKITSLLFLKLKCAYESPGNLIRVKILIW